MGRDGFRRMALHPYHPSHEERMTAQPSPWPPTSSADFPRIGSLPAYVFAAINADRVWDGSAPKARRARWLRKATIAAVVLFGLYSMLSEWL